MGQVDTLVDKIKTLIGRSNGKKKCTITSEEYTHLANEVAQQNGTIKTLKREFKKYNKSSSLHHKKLIKSEFNKRSNNIWEIQDSILFNVKLKNCKIEFEEEKTRLEFELSSLQTELKQNEINLKNRMNECD